MRHYPVQITTTIENKDNNILVDFIKSINYKIYGKGEYDKNKPHFIQYTFSYTNSVKFMRLLQDLGYNFKIEFFDKVVNGIAIYK
ncbi:MAG: hypothetical protein ACO3TG_04050 [Minisyncoccia bacterium]